MPKRLESFLRLKVIRVKIFCCCIIMKARIDTMSKMILRYRRPVPVLGDFARYAGAVNYGPEAKRYEKADS